MRIFRNRIVISFWVIWAAAYVWEFYVKPVSGPIYTEAVSEYKNQNYQRSLKLLRQAYLIDPNDAAILTLMGWNDLKLGHAPSAETYLERAHRLTPHVIDTIIGYAYTEIALQKYQAAASLIRLLRQKRVDTLDFHLASATLFRATGQNRNAAREFELALEQDKDNPEALKNLREIFNVTADVRLIRLDFKPLVRAKELTYRARVEGEHFAWQVGGTWKPVYLKGVNLTPSVPGFFPIDSATDPSLYADWLERISELGANTLRVYTILPAAFYRAFFQFNGKASATPLRLLQGISFGDPPRGDFFNRDYYQACLKQIRDTIDAIHGQGDIGPDHAYAGGLYPNDVSAWVTGFVIGQTWLPHVVTANNQLHPDVRSFRGVYIDVPSGSPTEIFLAQMINYAAEYEEATYNWQHPIAFHNWPTLDPMRHPAESTMLEEVSIRRAMGERVLMTSGPYDDDDAVSLDPTHLRAREGFPAGFFAAYGVFPFYPDFINHEPRYREAQDEEGSNPFLGYLQDLKAYHRGMPLVITEYGIPTSLGIGHFSPAGFNEGGMTDRQQGELLARFTRNLYQAGAAGGTVFEWLDQWFRQTWLVRNFENPPERRVLWTNFMDPAQSYGLLAADSHRRSVHRLNGNPSEWGQSSPLYAELPGKKFQALGDGYDSARNLKALYAEADEGFLYLRLVVDKLDNDNNGQAVWNYANYLIGFSTLPGRAGLTSLPFIAPIRFPMGMTYAIQLTGPESSRIWIASPYNPYRIVPVERVPSQTVLITKLGWKPKITGEGSFEPQVIEPNRRRFARDGRFFPPLRYDRGTLRYGSLDPQAPDYDPLAEWHANLRTNSIDLRIPWNLLNVTDPSSFKVLAGTEKDGTVQVTDTSGFMIAVFSYCPLEAYRIRPIMEQGHPVADALPGMAGPATLLAAALKNYRWAKWDIPKFQLRTKDSYPILQKTFLALPESPSDLQDLPHPFATDSKPRKTSAGARIEAPSRR